MKNTLESFYNPTRTEATIKGRKYNPKGNFADRYHSAIGSFLVEAKRDYTIRKAPDQYGWAGESREAKGRYHLVRGDTGERVSVQTVSDQYAPLSLADVAGHLETFTEQGWVEPDGVHGNGPSKEILQLRFRDDLSQVDTGGGDQVLPYISVCLQHGTGLATGKLGFIRVICRNTFGSVMGSEADFEIRHSKSIGEADDIAAERFGEQVASWEKLRRQISALSERIEAFRSLTLTPAKMKDLTETLLGFSGAEKISTQKENQRDFILSKAQDLNIGTRGQTGYDFYNGVTFLTTHGMPNSKRDSQALLLASQEIGGQGFELEAKARDLLLALA